MSQAVHNQVWAKVNAQVDRGIADLIQALSLFPQLETLESCQDIGGGEAWVCFRYGENWRDLSGFVLGFLGPKCAAELGDSISLSLQITSMGFIQAEVVIRPGAMNQAVNHIKILQQDHRRGRP